MSPDLVGGPGTLSVDRSVDRANGLLWVDRSSGLMALIEVSSGAVGTRCVYRGGGCPSAYEYCVLPPQRPLPCQRCRRLRGQSSQARGGWRVPSTTMTREMHHRAGDHWCAAVPGTLPVGLHVGWCWKGLVEALLLWGGGDKATRKRTCDTNGKQGAHDVCSRTHHSHGEGVGAQGGGAGTCLSGGGGGGEG